MTETELTEIDGIGPSMGERFAEHGYEYADDLLDADPAELSEIKQVTEDTALEFIVQAQDLVSEEEEAEGGDEFDLTPSDLAADSDEEEQSGEAEAEEQSADLVEEDSIEEEEEAEEPEIYTISLSFDSRLSYDTYHAALLRRHEDIYTGRQQAADTIRACLDDLSDFDSVEHELDRGQLNELHATVSQQRNSYQGANLMDHMEALRSVERQLNAQRDEYLFD